MREVRLEGPETYIYIRQKTVAQYIATSPILELFLEAERHMGERVAQR